MISIIFKLKDSSSPIPPPESSPYYTPNPIEPFEIKSKFNAVPDHIEKPPYFENMKNKYHLQLSILETEEELERMKNSCKLARKVLNFAETLIEPGITTEEIDSKVFDFIISHNAYPSPLRYGAFPKSICTSVNEVFVHGIPDQRPLQLGDVISVDVTVYLNGYHGDTCKTFIVGGREAAKREEHVELVEIAQEAMYRGISVCGPNVPMYEIGCAIDDYLKSTGKNIKSSGDFVGHGVGKYFHSLPQVCFTKNKAGREETGIDNMIPGMVFTIEPLICGESTKHKTWKDKWTIISAHRYLSAQFEHTVLITPNGFEVLTKDE
ncbi:hypothetical protein ABK040_015590 [Willaertia magna]